MGILPARCQVDLVGDEIFYRFCIFFKFMRYALCVIYVFYHGQKLRRVLRQVDLLLK